MTRITRIAAPLFLLTLGAQLDAWQGQTPQTGMDSIPRTYKGKAIISSGDTQCAYQMGQVLWGLKSSKGHSWTNIVPTAKHDWLNGQNQDTPRAKPFLTPGACPSTKKEEALPLIIHASIWQADSDTDGNFAQVSSQWQVYRKSKGGLLADGSREMKGSSLKEVPTPVDGQQTAQPTALNWPARTPLYNDKAAMFAGFGCFYDMKGNPIDSDRLKALAVTYKIGITEVIPDNISNFNAVLQALGLAKAAQPAAGGLAEARPLPPPSPPMPCFVTTAKITVENLPSDISFTLTVKDSQAKSSDSTSIVPARLGAFRATNLSLNGPDALPVAARKAIASTGPIFTPASFVSSDQAPGAGGGGNAPPAGGGGGNAPATNNQTQQKQSDCSSISKAGCSVDHTIRAFDLEWWDIGLGLNIPGVKQPQYSSSNPPKQSSPKTQSSFYGFVNLYPFSRFGSKTSAYPSLVGGIPVTGQVFYQPFVGLSEDVTGWAAGKKWLPLQINLVAGLVFLKQQEALANAQGTLQVEHNYVRKFMFGIEVPVSSLASKIKSITGGSGSNTSTKSQSGGGT
jgi:hypothetical protein